MKVKNTVFRNRIFAAPTSLKELTDHNHLDTKGIFYFKRKAQGGAASVALGEGVVHPTGCVDWSYKVKLYDPRSESGLYDLAGAVRQHGAVPSLELNHAGMHFHDDNRINYGPSDMVDEFDQGDGYGIRRHEIREMPREIIEEVTDAYGKAALRAKHCRFGQVIVHAGHGWLLSQFLSPVLNKRTDEFGGSLENRARITKMVLEKIRKYCGKNFPIEVRVSWKEGKTEGCQLKDTIEFCKMLESYGADMIQVSCGSLHFHDTTNLSHPSWFDTEEGINLQAAAEIKKHLNIPIGTVGAVSDPYLADQWIGEGKIDYVVMASALIADPDLPRKAMSGRADEIRPCIRCLSCHNGGYFNLPLHCSVNPAIGRDMEFAFPPISTEKKRVLIAGGGPGGMTAALTAAKRGHEVILCEKQDHLGGLLTLIETEPFKNRIGRYREYLERMIGKSSIDVRLNTEVTPKLIENIRPDKVIAAVGGKPVLLPIPGIEKAVPVLEYYKKKPALGNQVLVLGGGFAGVECAIGLAMEKKKVTVIEMGEEIASSPDAPAPGTGVMQLDALKSNAEKHQVQILLQTKCVEVTEEGAWCENPKGEKIFLKADAVITASGMRPDEETVNRLREASLDFIWIGDCQSPGLIRTAVREGFDAAMDI